LHSDMQGLFCYVWLIIQNLTLHKPTMKIFKAIKWVSLALILIILSVWFFIDHDNRNFLYYGALRIKNQPASVKIIDYHTSGWMDQQYEYYVSLNKGDLSKLLSGRKYNYTPKAKDYINQWATDADRYNFTADTCFTSGDLSTGMINVFVNKESTNAYVVYDVK
jgi:hypothetical protein